MKKPKKIKKKPTGLSEAFPVSGGAPLVAVPPGVGVTPGPADAPKPTEKKKKKASPTTNLTSAPSGKLVKLDLGSGQSPREGFEGVDVAQAEGVTHVVDLWKFPWPWADNSVDELHCSHFIEHIPMEYVGERHRSKDLDPVARTPHAGKDLFFAFFDECFRILKHDGSMTVITPAARSNRAFQDPTHRRFIVAETFCYLSADWRKGNKLDHYRAVCNFIGNVTHTMLMEEAAKNPEAQNTRFNHYWNTVLDWHCTMKAIKTPPQA